MGASSGAAGNGSDGGKPAFRRILVKLSGEALMGELDYGTDPDRVAAIAEQVKLVAERGVEIAMHIAAVPTVAYVSEEEVPEDVKTAEVRVFEQQAADKPENVRPKIAEGRLRKWLEEVVLLNQEHVNSDKYEGKTIEELRTEIASKTGENVRIARFTRFEVGGE